MYPEKVVVLFERDNDRSHIGNPPMHYRKQMMSHSVVNKISASGAANSWLFSWDRVPSGERSSSAFDGVLMCKMWEQCSQ